MEYYSIAFLCTNDYSFVHCTVVESSIWNILIPSRPEFLDDIDDSNDDEMMIYHQCQSKVRKPTIRVDFKPFNFVVQQHESTEPTESNTTNYILFGFVCMEFSLV